MSLKSVSFTQSGSAYSCDQNEDQSGRYIKFDDVTPLVDILEKLVWEVHFGKFFDASAAATRATELLSRLKAA
jgi:hypothetical protein